MKTRTKWFLAALFAAMVIAAASGEPKLLIASVVMFFILWLVWRGFIFLSLLLRPVRDKIRPQVDATNPYIDSALRRSGLDAVANGMNKLQAGIDASVSASQDGIDRR